MGYEVKILADSLAENGVRLTTFQVTFPRFILAEVNTHRMLSRNFESSRAIPTIKRIDRVTEDPFIPEFWTKNERGMSGADQVDEAAQARSVWISAAQCAVTHASYLAQRGVHKNLANRLLEPFTWVTGILTSTEWANFFWLRCAKDAQPEFRTLALMMAEQYHTHVPTLLPLGYYHLPLIFDEDRTRFGEENLARIAVGRCARVSYLTHDGKRDPEADLHLADRLEGSGHWSPFEHVASPIPIEHVGGLEPRQGAARWSGNFRGWYQYRKRQENENRGRLANDWREYASE